MRKTTRKHSSILHWKDKKPGKAFSYNGSKEKLSRGIRLSTYLGLKKLGIWHETVRPGERTSWPHAHSKEEEFVYVLEGNPKAWIDGQTYRLKPGDAVGFPAGTGIAHTFLNNTGKRVRLLVIGEVKIKEDSVFYPMHPLRNEECKKLGYFWNGHPKRKMGRHDGLSDKLRRSKIR